MNEYTKINQRPYDTALDGAEVMFVMIEVNTADDEWVGVWRIMGCATDDEQLSAMASKMRGTDAVVVAAGTAFHYANRMADELPSIPAAVPLWKWYKP